MKWLFKLLFLLTLGVAQAQAVQCHELLHAYNKLIVSNHIKSIFKPLQTRNETVQVIKGLTSKLKEVDTHAAVSAQTVLSSGRGLEQFLTYLSNFPETEFLPSSKEHALLVQTAYLLEMPPGDAFQRFLEVPADVRGFKTNTARAMIMQASLFSGRDIQDVLDFYVAAKKTSYQENSFIHHSILQMAFLAYQPVEEVNSVYRALPYYPGVQSQKGVDGLHRLLLITED